MAKTIIFPAALKQQSMLLENIKSLESVGVKSGASTLKKSVEKLGKLIDSLAKGTQNLEKALDKEDSDAIIEAMLEVRSAADGLEKEVDDSIWSLPKYKELLFIY
jgi:glutamine synthetase